MSIQPLDLQTLFTQMSHVGKEHAHSREAVVHGQDLQAQKILEETQRQDHSIVQADKTEQEDQKIRDEHSQNAPGGHKGSGKKDSKEPEGESEEKPEVIREPYLGKNIDLSG